jgi:hypothetical protein
MPVKLTNVSGNGSIQPNSIYTYSYSEEVTSLEPSQISGATSQVNVSAISVDTEATDPHTDSKLLINNEMTLDSDAYGSVDFRVRGVSKNLNTVFIIGDTIQSRLNVERRAEPVCGPQATLLSAIIYYCQLVDIVPVIDTEFADEMDAIPVNFLGWTGVLWDKLKELCAGFSASTTDNVGIEMIVVNNELVIRKAKQVRTSLQRSIANESINIESFDSARSVTVFNYNTSYGEDKVFYSLSNFDESTPLAERFQSSISDSMQVNAGETLRKRFKINATLQSVNQPVCVEQIDRIFPEPYEGGPDRNGQYVIVGVDDLPIKPSQWIDNGGSVTVELIDENGELLPPGEIDLVIKAPTLTGLPHFANEDDIGFSPYKIGVESSGEAEYPALWLTGTGTFFNKQSKLLLTGSSSEYTSRSEGPTVDNIFIINSFNASSRGVAAAQANCGPRIQLDQEVTSGVEFGDVGSMFISGLNQYRIQTIDFNESLISLSSTTTLSFAEWNEIWGTSTFQDFEDRILDPELFPDESFKFNEFSIMPMIGPL